MTFREEHAFALQIGIGDQRSGADALEQCGGLRFQLDQQPQYKVFKRATQLVFRLTGRHRIRETSGRDLAEGGHGLCNRFVVQRAPSHDLRGG